MTIPRHQHEPTFLWQGILIILPALMMAAFGLWSLRQDRKLAQLEVTEQAKKTAQDLTDIFLPAAFNGETVFASAQADINTTGSEAGPSERLTLHGEPAIVCMFNARNQLLYPPLWQEYPSPEPLPLETTTSDQRMIWAAAQEALHVTQDANLARTLLTRVMAEDFPNSFPAVAAYQLGVLYENADRFAEAVSCFEKVIAFNKNTRPLSEGGLPLRVQAAMHLLQLPSYATNPRSGRTHTLIRLIANEALLHPTVLSEAWLASLPENERWLNLWKDHEKGRLLAEHWQLWKTGWDLNSTTPQTTQKSSWHWIPISTNQELLVMSSRLDGGMACVALSRESVTRITADTARSLHIPPYFGLDIELAGKPVLAAANDAPVLASLPSASVSPAFRVQVRLVNPAALYARQRTRTLWMGVLISLSLSAVLIGFAAAWRAFHRQQQLSEMKTNFVSSVSHELRAPIASVRLMVEELTHQDHPDPSKVREYHGFIAQECQRLSGLIENILDFSRHEQGRKQYTFESTDLEALLTETCKLMQSYASGKNITIRSVILGASEPVEADGRALQQVLVNLIDNAIKHSPQNSEVEAGVQFDTRQVQLWVEDHGEGIPAGEQKHIFERFYRRGNELRRETQGVGLGLAIVKNIVEAHTGSVTVRSTPGQGSRFTVMLPINHSST